MWRKSAGGSGCFDIVTEAGSVGFENFILMAFGLDEIEGLEEVLNKLLVFLFVSNFVIIGNLVDKLVELRLDFEHFLLN